MNVDVEFDEYCDPNNPRKIKYDGILAASKRIVGAIVRTPCSKSYMSEKLGVDLYFKQEFMQYTGSFKERGVRNTLLCLSDEQKRQGVICASTGNHGLAMSYHSTQLGILCIVVMPVAAPITKRSNCEGYGAKLIMYGKNMSEAKRHAMTISKEKKMYYVNGYDHPNVIEGQGTIGIEIMEQVPNVDAILVPVGGGSILTGVAIAAKYLKPDIEVYGIETDKTASMTESLKKNERTLYKIGTALADGLAVNMVGVNTFYNLKQGVADKMIVVKEDWVARTIVHILEDDRFVIEGAGAASTAALFAGLLPQLKGKRVVSILSGGNIDTTILTRSLELGMAAEGRLIKFKVALNDRVGGLHELTALLSSIGVLVRDCISQQTWVQCNAFNCVNQLTVETRGWEHTKELIECIKKNFKEYYFPEMIQGIGKLSTPKRGPCLAPNPVCMQK